MRAGESYEIDREEPAAPAPSQRPRATDPLFGRDKYLLKQKLFSLLASKYDVCDEQGNKLLWVRRPARNFRTALAMLAAIITFFLSLIPMGLGISLVEGTKNSVLLAIVVILGLAFAFLATIAVAVLLSPKRHVHFFRDEAMTQEALQVLQETRFGLLNMSYSVIDPGDGVLAILQKNMLFDLIRKRWLCAGPDGRLLCVIREDSWVKALLRRFGGSWAVFLRTNFIINDPQTGRELGQFNRKFTLLDRYVLDMTPDAAGTIDRRVALAIGVMLDTGERR